WPQYFRFVLLFFNCLLSFGSYFCFDIPSVLQDQFQGKLTCPNATVINGTVDCVLGLGMTPQEYNFLFVIHSWTNAVVLILAGFLIDKLGNFGVYLFPLLCVLGSSLFALGSHFKGTPHMLPIMLIGRLLFGSGSGSVMILQDRITAFWFKGKELSLGFGLTLGFSRLGSVLNFFITNTFEERYGMQWTLWGGVLLCVMGFIITIIVGCMDKTGMRRLGLDGAIQEESSKLKIQDLKQLSLRYWLLVLTTMFFYNVIFPFIADASKFIQDKFSSYSQKEAVYTVGAIYDVALLFTAVVGIIIDNIGLRAIFTLVCAILTLPVFGLLAFTYVPPLVSTIWLGVTYSITAVSTWPSIALVVPQVTLGTAIGVANSVQMLGNGVANLIIGQILGTVASGTKIPLWRWQWMMVFMLANMVSCIVTAALLNIVDHRQGGTLNKTSKRSEQAERDLVKESLNHREDERDYKAIKSNYIKF
uniref:Lysosomal dipeptide transporter MFSD1 n=1 Tax=Mola mola TaxID=94237 RepID=A0A3Q3VM17_MOLML